MKLILLILFNKGPNGGSKPKNVVTPQMVQRILQLKKNDSTIYAHEIRTELQREFGKVGLDGTNIGPAIPSVSSINRILRTNSEPTTNSSNNENSSQLQSSVNSLQSNQLSSYYYSQLNNNFATPSTLNSTVPKHLQSYTGTNATNTSSFGNLYDSFSAANNLTATNGLSKIKNETSGWPRSSLSSSNSSGYSSSYSSSGSNSPVGSSGSSSPTEFSPYAFRPTESSLPSHYHASSAHLLFNGLNSVGLLNNPIDNQTSTDKSSIGGHESKSVFDPFYCSQTKLQTTATLQKQSNSQNSIYYSLPTSSSSIVSSSNKKKSRKYSSYYINEILGKRSDEEDIDVEDIDED